MSSVFSQLYEHIEYIIIDGGSTDGTLEKIGSFTNDYILISEPDKGVYDALNKGIKRATGDIVGFLHADDFFASNEVVNAIVKKFELEDPDVLFGDLMYVHPTSHEIIRKWKSSPFKMERLNFGWMPPHPTFYMKKSLFDRVGYYSLEFGTAGDYEFMIRVLRNFTLKVSYLPKLFVKMRLGGMSNSSLENRLKAFENDYKAVKLHNFKYPFITTVLKKARKIFQYF